MTLDTITEQDFRLHMFLRLLMLASVLVSAVFYQQTSYFNGVLLTKTYLLIFFNFLFSCVFILSYEKIRQPFYFLIGLTIFDILFTTSLIFYTESTESMYVVFYLFNIVFAAMVFRRTGALGAALLSGLLYSFLSSTTLDYFSGKTFSVITTITSFLVVGLLSGQLVEDLKKSRQRVSRLEKLNEEIVDSLDSGLLGFNEQCAIEKINPMALKLLALESSKQVIGKTLREVVPALADLERGSVMHEVRDLVIQGKQKRILISRVELPENHGMILLRDLSEILNLEQQMRRQEHMAGIGRLAAGLAHEIRNPIASISGSAQLLIEKNEELERKKLLDIVVRESDRVNRLVSQLLDFAKPSRLLRQPVKLADLVQECIDATCARPDFQNEKVKIYKQVEPGLIVIADRDQLREAITNLIVNSIQASSQKIEVAAYRKNNAIEIIISDNGAGIPSQHRERIFEPFFTTRQTGTGLGLAQVYKMVRNHDGQVDIQSEEGKGTKLKLRIPA